MVAATLIVVVFPSAVWLLSRGGDEVSRADLAGSWTLEELLVAGRPLGNEPGVPHEFTIELTESGRVTGNGPCNTSTGQGWSFTDDTLTFDGEIFVTLEGCLDERSTIAEEQLFLLLEPKARIAVQMLGEHDSHMQWTLGHVIVVLRQQ